MSQTERIFHIDRSIREAGGTSIRDIAKHFEICPRQAKRDIEYMRDRLRAPIVWSVDHRRYEYSSDWDCLRSADEKSLFALAFLSSILTEYSYVPVVSDDLLALLKERIAGRYSRIVDKVRYELPDMESIDGEIAYALCEALAGPSWLDIDYTDAKGDSSARSIVPVRLVNYAGKWYCVALDSKSGKLRTFSVARIDAAAARNPSPTASPHAGSSEGAAAGTPADLPSDEEIDRFLSSSYGIFKGEPIGRATLRFYRGAARAVREQVWHRDQIITPVSPDPSAPAAGGQESSDTQDNRASAQTLDLSLPVHDWTELLGRALRCGANCEVMAPAEFRTRWVEEIRRMASLARADVDAPVAG